MSVKAKNDPLKLLDRPLLPAPTRFARHWAGRVTIAAPAERASTAPKVPQTPMVGTATCDPKPRPATTAGRPKEGGRQPVVVKTTDNGGNKADFRQ